MSNLASKNEANAARNHGGAIITNVTVVLNPSVAPSVGKNMLNDSGMIPDINTRESHQTFKSVTASQKPLPLAASFLKSRFWGMAELSGRTEKSYSASS